MILDKEEHRGLLLEALNAVMVPGAAIDTFVELRASIRGSQVMADVAREAQVLRRRSSEPPAPPTQPMDPARASD